MKKIFINLIYIILICIISIEVIINNKVVVSSVRTSFSIWQNNIFPSLFPFLILGSILISLNFGDIIGELFKNIFFKLFKINKNGTFIIILSILSGFPSSAKYIVNMYELGNINEKEASKLLCFTHFSNPLFIFGYLSNIIGNNSLYVLICHYIGNIFIGLIFRKYYISKIENSNIHESIKKLKNNNSIGYILSNSINNTINTLLLILGSISVFIIVNSLINNIFNLNGLNKIIINGIFEMTSGLNNLNRVNLSLNIKTLLSIIILSFGGLSVHLQVYTIINNTKIKYFPYFIARILHAIISSLIYIIWKVL